jgi:hypothetical protein
MKRFITAGALAMGVMITLGGCGSHQPWVTTPSQESSQAQWIGHNRVELAHQMGQPKEAVPMTDTGGEMLFYSYEGHHYVFETDPLGNITSAVQTR